MVVVPKKNGALWICLDPKDLNKAIQRKHYPLPTIEDVATGEGLCVDPSKVRAIEMPPPKDVAAMQRLLGLAQYLGKFLPHLSDNTRLHQDQTGRHHTEV